MVDYYLNHLFNLLASVVQQPSSLKMAVEFDEKHRPGFFVISTKLHKKLCLLSYLPSMVEDLSFHTNEDRTIDFNIYIEHAKQCLKEIATGWKIFIV